jgi:DNA-binding response OmpR family regulator
MPHRVLLEAVWGAERCPGIETLHVYVNRVRRRLRRRGATIGIENQWGWGYRLTVPTTAEREA